MVKNLNVFHNDLDLMAQLDLFCATLGITEDYPEAINWLFQGAKVIKRTLVPVNWEYFQLTGDYLDDNDVEMFRNFLDGVACELVNNCKVEEFTITFVGILNKDLKSTLFYIEY